MPSKEPSPLLDKKIEELEAKFADVEDLDEDLDELEDEDDDAPATPSMPQHQSSLMSDMDLPNLPLQVTHARTHTQIYILYHIKPSHEHKCQKSDFFAFCLCSECSILNLYFVYTCGMWFN